MIFNNGLACLIGAGLLGAAIVAGPAPAADYPLGPIELVVPYAAGGGTDLLAHAFADAAGPYLGQPLGVVNKPGGGGAAGLTAILTARPNGYRIGMGTVELAMLPHMGAAAFDYSGFVPIARLNAEPAAVTVRADAPWDTIEAFLADAGARPGAIRVGNSGTGAVWHIAAEALGRAAGVRFASLPHDGAGPAVAALLQGGVEAVTVSPAEVSGDVAAGRLRILAVMADERLPKLPDVPTLKEKGLEVSVATWRGIVVPKGTPEPVVRTLRDAARATAAAPAFIETLDRLNLTPAYLEGPEFGQSIARDDVFFAAMIKDLGLTY